MVSIAIANKVLFIDKFKGTVTSILFSSLLNPHCILLYEQWGTAPTYDIGTSELPLPISFKRYSFQSVLTWNNPDSNLEWENLPAFTFATELKINTILVARGKGQGGPLGFRYLAIGQ